MAPQSSCDVLYCRVSSAILFSGTRRFRVELSKDNKIWTRILHNELPDPRGACPQWCTIFCLNKDPYRFGGKCGHHWCDIPMRDFGVGRRIGRYVKFTCETYWGDTTCALHTLIIDWGQPEERGGIISWYFKISKSIIRRDCTSFNLRNFFHGKNLRMLLAWVRFSNSARNKWKTNWHIHFVTHQLCDVSSRPEPFGFLWRLTRSLNEKVRSRAASRRASQ